MTTTEQEQDGIFGAEHHGALIRNAPEIHETLREFIQKCWYTDELLVVDQPLEKNQELFHDWISQELGEEFEVVRVTADMLMTAEELLQQVLEEFGLESEDGEFATTLLQALNEGALGERERPTELLIQVENAHELGEGVLTELLALIAGHEERLTPHIALWGDMRQTDALHSLDSDERARIALLRIAPFKPEEVGAYLEYCWERFDSEEEFPFSKAQVAALLDESGGVIDELDELALEQLEGEGEGWHPPKWHALAVVVLGIALVIIFLSRKGEPEESGRRIVTLELPSSSPEPALQQEQQAEEQSPVTGAGESEPAPEIAEVDEPSSLEAEPQFSAEELETEVTETITKEPAPEPEPAPPEQEEIVSANALFSHQDNAVFLQLMGSFDEEAARQFMADNRRIEDNGSQLYQFESRYQEKPWYVVVFGPFAGRGEAEAARDTLPRHLQLGEPWPRSMADIRRASEEK